MCGFVVTESKLKRRSYRLRIERGGVGAGVGLLYRSLRSKTLVNSYTSLFSILLCTFLGKEKRD